MEWKIFVTWMVLHFWVGMLGIAAMACGLERIEDFLRRILVYMLSIDCLFVATLSVIGVPVFLFYMW